jgi:hypothetical protein
MSLYSSVGVVGRAWRSTLPFASRPRFWGPFLLIAAAQFLLLGLLLGFHRPGIQPLGVPLVRLFGGEQATHYPILFLLLPGIYAKVALLSAVFVSSLATAAATLLFARGFGFHSDGRVTRPVFRRAPSLILVTGFSALLMYLPSKLVSLVPQDLFLTNALLRWSTRGGLLLAAILVQSFLAYGIAWVVLEGHRAPSAVRDSVLVTRRTFQPTALLVAIPFCLLQPLTYLTQRVDLFLEKLRPETMLGLVAAQIVLQIVLGFLLVGGVTRLFLWRLEAAR